MKFITTLLLLTSTVIYSQTSYIVDSAMIKEYPFLYETDKMIETLKKDPVLKNATWGFSLFDPLAEKEIINKDAYRNYIPASTTKIPTTESALRLLGEDFNWKTQISYTGEVDSNGELNGNLYVLWNGDPTLGFDRVNAKTYYQLYAEALQQIKIEGIKKVKGKILFESVVFSSEKELYPFDDRMIDFGNYFSLIPTGNEELSAEELAYNEKAKNEEDIIEDNAELEDLSIEDQIMMDVIASIEINNKLNKLQAIGKKNHSLAAPPAYFTKLFYSYLSKNGINVSGGYHQQNYLDLEIDTPRKKLMYYESPSLAELVYFVNHKSSNVYAQHILRTIGIFIGKRDSEYTSVKTLYKKLEDVNYYYNDFSYTDGSGLSYKNQASPITQVKYLATTMYQPYFETFYKSLPTAGVDGTLRTSFKNSPHNGVLHAKTGTLGQIPTKTLAGYLTLKNGKVLCFSLLINRFRGSTSTVKLRMEKLLNTVY